MREPDSERRKERRRKGRAKKVERDRKEEKEKEMEKKSSLSGFGNSDSWGPFVLITAEQRFCRY